MQSNDTQAKDQQIMNELAGEVRSALAYLRAAQGFGKITVRLTVRNGVITLAETGPVRSIKPAYVLNRARNR
jgi:hypothetical protein